MIMKNTPKVIAVSGGMHTGKTEVIKILSEMLPHYNVDMFSYPLKLYIAALTGDDINNLEFNGYKSQLHPELNIAPREAMTTLGKFSMETYRKDIFPRSLFNRNKDKPVIITDLRMPEEYEYVKKHNGFIIKIERFFDLRFPGLKDYTHPKNRYNFNDRTLSYDHPNFYKRLTHYTENQINKIYADRTIENNGSLEELKQKIEHIWI